MKQNLLSTIDLGTFPEDWTLTSLGQQSSKAGGFIQTGPFGSQLHASDYQSDGVPVVNPTNMLDDRINHTNIPRVSKATADRLARHYVNRGDILFARRGDIGRHGLVTSKESGWLCGTGCFLVRAAGSHLNARYLSYWLSTAPIVAWLQAHAAGAIMPNLNNVVLSNTPLLFPPRPEQEKIAAVLWKIQRAIEVEEKLVATARELKQSAMRQLFTHGLRGESQKERVAGSAPRSWHEGRVIDLAHFQRGFDITKKSQTTGTVPVVSSGGIRSWHNESAAKAPGVVIGRKGSIGSIHYIDRDYWPHDTTLWCTDFRGNAPLFVFYRLHLLDLKRLDSGATNPALNRNFLHEEPITWPEVDEQVEIANFLQTIDRKISIHERKRATLQDLFKTMLHQLMTAQIRVVGLDIDTREVTI